MKKFPVALQLYSVRDDMAGDFAGTLKKVADMGYQGVEFAGLFGRTPAEVRELCRQNGLIPLSAHVPYTEMVADPEKVLGDYAAIGCRYVAIPHYPWNFREGESYETFIEHVKMLGRTAEKHGMTLLYHNHDFEFEKMDGVYRLERLYADVPAELLQTELDVCWVKVGGEEPAPYVRKYSGRAPVVHLKDFAGHKSANMYALIGVNDNGQTAEAKPQEFEFRPVGYGRQDIPTILKAAEDAGAAWVVVEMDMPSLGKTALECAAMSRHYLATLSL